LVIEPQFFSLGCSPHGTRVVQKIIEVVSNNKELTNLFISIFQKHFINLMKDVNGNHIIIKFVFTFKEPVDNFIYEQINDHLIELCLDKHGCCVLQKCIEGASKKQRDFLINNIINNTNNFILDQYANYVVQYVVSLADQQVNKKFAQQIIKNDINYLSRQRFSSNVIEKCFDSSNKEVCNMIIEQLINPEIIKSLLFDMYGNYVLQKAISLSSEPHNNIFITTIASSLDSLKNYSNFGSKLYTKLINTYPQLNYIKGMSYQQNNGNNLDVNYVKNNNKKYNKKSHHNSPNGYLN